MNQTIWGKFHDDEVSQDPPGPKHTHPVHVADIASGVLSYTRGGFTMLNVTTVSWSGGSILPGPTVSIRSVIYVTCCKCCASGKKRTWKMISVFQCSISKYLEECCDGGPHKKIVIFQILATHEYRSKDPCGRGI